jgi:hypothetical protein
VPHDRITKPFLVANLLTSLPLTAAVIVASTYAVQVGPFSVARYQGTQVSFSRFQTITDLLLQSFVHSSTRVSTNWLLDSLLVRTYACQQRGTSATATNVWVPFRCRSEWAFICFRWQFGVFPWRRSHLLYVSIPTKCK